MSLNQSGQIRPDANKSRCPDQVSKNQHHIAHDKKRVFILLMKLTLVLISLPLTLGLLLIQGLIIDDKPGGLYINPLPVWRHNRILPGAVYLLIRISRITAFFDTYAA